MRVTITDLAKADLSEIGDFILEDNPLRAESFVYELLDRCAALRNIRSAIPSSAPGMDASFAAVPSADI
jgi:plasmid stabilization system protein ParE